MGKRPHSASAASPSIIRPVVENEIMKTRPRKQFMTFGDFVAGVYRAWGRPQAVSIVKLAIKMRLIEFVGTDRLVVT
jgi:hypothetical protein